jgi:hypothetical protein
VRKRNNAINDRRSERPVKNWPTGFSPFDLFFSFALHKPNQTTQQPTQWLSLTIQQPTMTQWQIPDYTSPPTQLALELTPEAFRPDAVIDSFRNSSALHQCNLTGDSCQMEFHPKGFTESKIGVLFYGAALVDPRAYSPLASTLADRYGLPVVVPVFEKDMPLNFGACSTGRLELAQAAFPDVDSWILTGHSMGGIAASADAWSMYNGEDPSALGGLVMLAADVRQDFGCGELDFSLSGVPMASLTGSNDETLDRARFDGNKRLMTQNATCFLDILGGTHHGFGAYDSSLRADILHMSDGKLEIPFESQWESTTGAIYNVAGRTGMSMPTLIEDKEETAQTGITTRQTRVANSAADAAYQRSIFTLALGSVFLWARNGLN